MIFLYAKGNTTLLDSNIKESDENQASGFSFIYKTRKKKEYQIAHNRFTSLK